MITFEDGVISLTRGDTAYLHLNLTNNGEPYEFQEGDTVTLTVKQNYDEEKNYLFQKVVAAGDTIVIEPQDTKPYEYGRYVYDVQVNTAIGEVFTVVGPNTFKLTKEATL